MRWPDDKLTRFEAARLIGARSLQIALGAPVLVKETEGSSTEIAKKEFFSKAIPMTVKREFPTGETVVVQMNKAIDKWVEEQKDDL